MVQVDLILLYEQEMGILAQEMLNFAAMAKWRCMQVTHNQMLVGVF